MVELRRHAIREWTCPNHPEGPPTLPADGYDREELTLSEAYGDELVDALRRLCALRVRDGEKVARSFGLCCIGHAWKVVGYETVEVTGFQLFLEQMVPRIKLSPAPILLAELSAEHPGEPVRIPITRGDT